MSTTTAELPLDLVHVAEPGRQRSLLVATALVAAAGAVGVLTSVALYTSARQAARAAHAAWIPAGAIPLSGPNIALFTLLISVPAMQWAVYAIGRDDRQSNWVATAIVLLLGVAFVNAETFIWGRLGLGIHKSRAALLLFTTTGLHLAMVVGGMLYILLMGFRTLGGQYDSRDREGVASAALFWYVTVALFGVLWYAIYVTK